MCIPIDVHHLGHGTAGLEVQQGLELLDESAEPSKFLANAESTVEVDEQDREAGCGP